MDKETRIRRTQAVIYALAERGWTGYAIARRTKVTVDSVRRWKSGRGVPSDKHFDDLNAMMRLEPYNETLELKRLEVGKNITMLKKYRRWKHTHLAKALGVSRKALGRYERALVMPGVETMDKLAEILKNKVTAPLTAQEVVLNAMAQEADPASLVYDKGLRNLSKITGYDVAYVYNLQLKLADRRAIVRLQGRSKRRTIRWAVMKAEGT